MTTTAPSADPSCPIEATADPAAKAFSISVVVSGIRCMLAYVVLPWVLPLLGVTGAIGPVIGLVVGPVAIGFNVASIRRFWRADHRWKWQISAINASFIVLLLILLVRDVAELAATPG